MKLDAGGDDSDADYSRFTLMFTLFMSFSVATTVLSTIIITIRIFMHDNIGSTSNRKRYSKALEIIIESSALYSIALLVQIPFYVINNASENWVSSMEPYTEAVANSMAVSFRLNIYLLDHSLISGHRSCIDHATSIDGQSTPRYGMDAEWPMLRNPDDNNTFRR